MFPHFFLLSLLAGFLIGGSVTFGPWFEYRGFLFLGSALVLAGGVWWWPEKFRYCAGVVLGIAGALIVGAISYQDWRLPVESRIFTDELVRVVSFPQEKNLRQEVYLDRLCDEKECRRGILWRAPLEAGIVPGERFVLTCEAEGVKNFSEEFDYRMYLAKEGVGYICREGTKGESLSRDTQGRFWSWLAKSRAWTEGVLSRALPEPELGLAQGLILGGGYFLDKEVEAAFQRIGMTHIVAVSGYNILLVASGCFFVFGQLRLWRRQKIILGSIAVWIFILFVGAPASAVRAGSMALLFFLALFTGRRSSGFVVLILSAVLMLAHNPLLLFYDIGFQLSCLALVAILFASTHHHVREWHWYTYLWEAARTTLWVEIFILPLIVYYFGTLTWFSIVANIVLLPIIPLAMLGTFLLLPLGVLPQSVLLFLAAPVYVVLRGLIFFAEFFSQLSWVSWDGLSLSWRWLLGYYILLVALSVVQLQKRKKEWYAKAFVVDP